MIGDSIHPVRPAKNLSVNVGNVGGVRFGRCFVGFFQPIRRNRNGNALHLNGGRRTFGLDAQATDALADGECVAFAGREPFDGILVRVKGAPLILSSTARTSATLKVILSQRSPASLAISCAFWP